MSVSVKPIITYTQTQGRGYNPRQQRDGFWPQGRGYNPRQQRDGFWPQGRGYNPRQQRDGFWPQGRGYNPATPAARRLLAATGRQSIYEAGTSVIRTDVSMLRLQPRSGVERELRPSTGCNCQRSVIH